MSSSCIAALAMSLILAGAESAPADDTNLNGLWVTRSRQRVDPEKGTTATAIPAWLMALRHDRRTGEVQSIRVKLPPGSEPADSSPAGYRAPVFFKGRIDGDSIISTVTAFTAPLNEYQRKCPKPPAHGFRIRNSGRTLHQVFVNSNWDSAGCPIDTAPELVKAANLPTHSIYTWEAMYIVRQVRFVEANPDPGMEAKPLKTASAGQALRVQVLFDLAPSFPVYATLTGRSGPLDVIVKPTKRADVFESDVIKITGRR